MTLMQGGGGGRVEWKGRSLCQTERPPSPQDAMINLEVGPGWEGEGEKQGEKHLLEKGLSGLALKGKSE